MSRWPAQVTASSRLRQKPPGHRTRRLEHCMPGSRQGRRTGSLSSYVPPSFWGDPDQHAMGTHPRDPGQSLRYHGVRLYVRVILRAAAFQTTPSPRLSLRNRRGRRVRPWMITGTTFLSAVSMVTCLPFTVAVLLPIHSCTVLLPSLTVTLRATALHPTVPPRVSMSTRTGRSVRPFWIMGATLPEGSTATFLPFTVIVV